MNVQQLSVFIEDKTGRVSEITGVLGTAGVNIRGFSVSDTIEHGIVRLIVDDPDAGHAALTAAGFTVQENPVICLYLPDHPGGLSKILQIVSDAGVNIEYVYSLIGTHVVINVADVGKAASMLEGSPVTLVTQEDIARI